MKNIMMVLSLLLLPVMLLAGITPTQLTCEYLNGMPLVDIAKPRLAWVNIADKNERGQKQTAWQVRVATSPDLLESPDLWDSGKIESPLSNRIEYDGKTLQSRQECWWQVRVWDRNDKASKWSKPSAWRMGLLDPSEWQAQWIGAPWQGEEALPLPGRGETPTPPPAPLLRKSFQVNKPIKNAVAFVTGLGYFELYMNGEKIGNDVLVPNQTNYGKRPGLTERSIAIQDNFRRYKVLYLAYDVSDQFKTGENVIGGILGNGFYNPAKGWTEAYGTPRFLCQLYITYEDGSQEIIVSDGSWKADKSPILYDMVYYGEHYDARKEQPGWCAPGFDDAKWQKVALRNAPEGELAAHTSRPDRITEELKPVSIEKRDDGTWHVDFGVEISGWLRINNVKAPAGHKVEFNFISSDYSGDNSYTFRGEGAETYHARFNWFVFKEVDIINWPGKLKTKHLTALMVNTPAPVSAEFETSNPLFNDINRIWRRSQIDNMHGGLASDCPHRERSGYTGDGQVACPMVMQNYDARSFYYKWVQDMLEAQNPETGHVPNGAPWQPGCGGGIAWGAAICVIPWEFYEQYGSLDMLSDNYEGMKGYVGYMQKWTDSQGVMYSQRAGKNGIPLKWFNLGDWVPPGKMMPDEQVHTFYLWFCSNVTAKTAKELGKTEEAEKYAQIAENTKKAYHQRFYNAETGSYGNYGGNVLALYMGVPDEQYDNVTAALKANIAANDNHLDTGIIGTRFLFEVLANNGMHDLAYKVLNQRTEPSFGWWLELGATTTREQWNSKNSQNHPMFGGGLVWFYRNLAGMNADAEQPGYRHILFKPQPLDELDYVSYSNNTPYGKAGISWKQSEKQFEMDVTVPVGCTATVCVPDKNGQSLAQNDKIHQSSPFITYVEHKDGYTVYTVESGEYQFKVK